MKKKVDDDIHLSWKVPFEEGTVKAVAYKNGNKILEEEVIYKLIERFNEWKNQKKNEIEKELKEK